MVSAGELSRKKEVILVTIREKGPTLPVHIAREINFEPMFAAAFLSELKAEGKVKLSNMKVGSSPLYYLPGQELMLENFVDYLNRREKEAFLLLKEKKVLDDEKQEPVIRVALRAIKDFAIPVRIRVNGETRLFWKIFSISDDELRRRVTEEDQKKKKKPKEVVKETVKEVVKEDKKEKKERKLEKKEKQINLEMKEIEKKKERKTRLKESVFTKNVKEYLSSKDIEVLEVFSEKKRELEARVRIDIMFGKQIYYLIAKDKKNISESDLLLGLQKAQAEKLPAVLVSNGDLNKKAKEYLKNWENLVRFEKMRF